MRQHLLGEKKKVVRLRSEVSCLLPDFWPLVLLSTDMELERAGLSSNQLSRELKSCQWPAWCLPMDKLPWVGRRRPERQLLRQQVQLQPARTILPPGACWKFNCIKVLKETFAVCLIHVYLWKSSISCDFWYFTKLDSKAEHLQSPL